jgi:penicillin-binding protein 1A
MVTLKEVWQIYQYNIGKIIDKVGPEAVIDLTHKLGVKSEIVNQPSIALGAVEITVQDMVAAQYLCNQGVYRKNQFISKIER